MYGLKKRQITARRMDKQKKTKELSGKVLEILYICTSNPWFSTEERNAEKGGGAQSRREGGLANKDN